MVVFAQSGCIRVRVVVLGQKRLYSGKSSCIRAKCLYREKEVVFGQSGCVVVFRKKLLSSGKTVVFWQKWLSSGKLVVFGLR